MGEEARKEVSVLRTRQGATCSSRRLVLCICGLAWATSQVDREEQEAAEKEQSPDPKGSGSPRNA